MSDGTDALATLIAQWRDRAKRTGRYRGLALRQCADELEALAASLVSVREEQKDKDDTR